MAKKRKYISTSTDTHSLIVELARWAHNREWHELDTILLSKAIDLLSEYEDIAGSLEIKWQIPINTNISGNSGQRQPTIRA